jgi:hypothetical protein
MTYVSRPGWQDSVAAINAFLVDMQRGQAPGKIIAPVRPTGTAEPGNGHGGG